ncbi:MAG: hypothetical protein QN144_14355 [Armatimonadota bacterium]|nr:hypothetical protein [Armatimonadota bacterium]
MLRHRLPDPDEGPCPVCGVLPEERALVVLRRRRLHRYLTAAVEKVWQAYERHYQEACSRCTEADPGCEEGQRLWGRWEDLCEALAVVDSQYRVD